MSREDALSARLRLLRNPPSAGGRTSSPQPPNASLTPQTPGIDRDQKEKVGKDQALSPLASFTVTTEKPKSPYAFEEQGADVDYDNEAVDDYLAALGEDISAYTASSHGEQPEVTDKKVADLLEQLQKAIPPSDEDTDPGEADDDSDGEYMTRASEKILDQARDEMSLLSPTPEDEQKEDRNQRKEPRPEEGETDAAPNPTAAPKPNPDDTGDNPLSLPTVPTALVDPVDEDQNFEDDISARLAGLRGIGPVDAFGLPAAPTFRPEDRSPSADDKGKGQGTGLLKTKYTDDDQENWCTVCLEDATIRCVGCDNDAYCGRCWREMHVGPRAGYDERGHQWMKFSRGSSPL